MTGSKRAVPHCVPHCAALCQLPHSHCCLSISHVAPELQSTHTHSLATVCRLAQEVLQSDLPAPLDAGSHAAQHLYLPSCSPADLTEVQGRDERRILQLQAACHKQLQPDQQAGRGTGTGLLFPPCIVDWSNSGVARTAVSPLQPAQSVVACCGDSRAGSYVRLLTQLLTVSKSLSHAVAA